MKKLTPNEVKTIERAYRILEKHVRYGESYTRPDQVKQLVTLRCSHLEREVFLCIFLDAQNKIIATEELFQGTIDSSSVYPREVVKRALRYNASSCIFAHNHPSGEPEPSQADQRTTLRLRDALALVDIRTLDHIVVGGTKTVSFAERGLL